MSIADLGLIDYDETTLLIDGDIAVYKPCCVFNTDEDISRQMIAKTINNTVDGLMSASGCDKYIFFLTTKTNFRDDLVDDYKIKRGEVERPINLTWAKQWAMKNLNAHYELKLEADDLIGIHMNDDSIIWSTDKDLRQIPGKHLNDESREVFEVTETGYLEERGKKVYFEGGIGLLFQMLTGDTTDWIIGCGERKEAVYKSGKNKGKAYIKRFGIGPKKAMNLLFDGIKGSSNPYNSGLEVVIREYKKLHGSDWQENLETQANLLFMIREKHGDVIRRWTVDGRREYFDLKKGEILNGYIPEGDATN